VHRTTHTLKSIGATFGAMAMADLCRPGRIARRGTGGDAPVVAAIAAEHDRVTLALAKLV